uniref:Rho GTPase activating protein 32 n=1 Tax=Latimeria chalumnae TaxID=7897 RepID=H3BCI0_LATCH
CDDNAMIFFLSSQGRSWIVKRSYEDFRVLDKHLHLCIYDRRFSQLTELPRSDSLKDSPETITQMLMAYLSRLSAIADNKINCGPALTWMEVDNKGNHLLVHEESSINVPAIAAAHVIKRYIAQAADELSFEVGDIVSVIDMPPKEDTTWWRGKHGFQVGFFPSECVELINDKVPHSVTNSVPKPVSKKHGKLITFLRTFMKSRPTKQKLKQRGILKERVFGCDLGEHLLNSGHDVPQVLKSCTEFIEKHGIVDGIYRLSGIASNIQKLRHEFDSEQIPDLTKDIYLQDIHCVGSLCKLYFRELPNPLLTYQLYEKFSDAVSASSDEERLVKIHDVIQQLPPPHYRTLEFLMRHLAYLATFSCVTNMHTKNLAIVWAPNLLRSKQIESACFSGTAAFMEVRIQSVVVEFILNHVDVLFSSKLSSVIRDGAGHSSLSRPKSLLVSSPSTKLLTLEEAQARTQAQINSPVTADSKYIEVGDGPAALQGKFHTVIDFPAERKRPANKMKKSPVGSWRSFFNLGKSSSVSKRKLHRNPSEPTEIKAMALAGGRGETGTLRSAKSEESLTSLHNVEGEPKVYRPRRPRSSSDALSTSFNGEILDKINHCNSYDNLPNDNESDGDEGLIHVPALISPRLGDEVDLSPPDIGVASLDFDPMSFQCSPPRAEPEEPDSSVSHLDSATSSKDRLAIGRKELESVSQSQTPVSATSSEPVSPSQEKLTSPFFSPDLSPTEEKVSKHASFAEKVVHAFSPKAGRKATKSPPMNISEPITISVPSRVSEIMGAMPAPTVSTSPPKHSKATGSNDDANKTPPHMISMLLKTSEMKLSEVCHQEIQSKICATGPEIKGPSTERPIITQSKPTPTGQTQAGVVTLESHQEAVPVSSVSLLPPPPPPKHAARMLALALAESAQQAAIQSQKKQTNQQSAPQVRPQILGETQMVTPIEKPYLQPGILNEKITPVVTTHITATSSNMGTSQMVSSHWTATVSHTTETSSTVTSHRTTTASNPVPVQKSTEQQPAMGQVPAPITTAPSTTNQVLYIEFNLSSLLRLGKFLTCNQYILHPPPPRIEMNFVMLKELSYINTFTLVLQKKIPLLLKPNSFNSVTSAVVSSITTYRQQSFIGAKELNWFPARTQTEPEQCEHFVILFAVMLHPLNPHTYLDKKAFTCMANHKSCLKVRIGTWSQTPERHLEPKTAEPAPPFSADHNHTCTVRPASAMAVVHHGHPEKPRESSNVPTHHSRAETTPVHPHYSSTPPVPPVRSLESKIAAAVHSNLDAVTIPNYHSFMTSATVPISGEEYLPPPPPPPKPASLQQTYLYHSKSESVPEPGVPDHYLHQKQISTPQVSAFHYRPESVPPHVSYQSKADQYQTYSSKPETMASRYNTLASHPKASHHSKIRSTRVDYIPTLNPGLRTHAHPPVECPAYPTIRRVHSLHVPPTSVRSVPVTRTEVPPDDDVFYYPKPIYQYKPYQLPTAQSDYHVTQLQPFFENGRVHYRYSPYSSSGSSYLPSETAFYDLDPYGTIRLKQVHSFTSRDLAHVGRPQFKNTYPYPSVPPYPRVGTISHLVGKEHSFISRDVPPSPDVKHTYASWDPEEMEKYRMQSIRRESRTRQKVKGSVMSQYDNVAPVLQEELGGLEIVHLRSKSDPGKTGLQVSGEGKDGRYPAVVKTPEGEEHYYLQHQESDRTHYHSAHGNGQMEKPALPQKQITNRSRKFHGPTYDTSEHRTYPQQEINHRQVSDSKNGPPYHAAATSSVEYGQKHWQDHVDSKNYPSSTGKNPVPAQDPLRINYKDPRVPEERPDPDRPRARPAAGVEKLPRNCYNAEEQLPYPPAPPKPERSHSLRAYHHHHPESVERDQGLIYPYQTLGKRHSTMTVISQYDNLDDYHSMPPHQRGNLVGGGALAAPGFSQPHSRTYSTALGQGSFLAPDLSSQRPEAEIHAE